ncbi:MAG: SAM-dependent methyltransferase, partial [Flammeovirgaceae bacterium]|nr:SAM-dependent methyltransferase [Flammeovirgaceae bacterium]
MKLYLIPSPIGNHSLEFFPPIIKKIISETKYYFVENERTTRRYISSLKLDLNIRELIFFRLDKNTKTAQIADYFGKIPRNENIGVISEAGCPGIADPGALAVDF